MHMISRHTQKLALWANGSYLLLATVIYACEPSTSDKSGLLQTSLSASDKLVLLQTLSQVNTHKLAQNPEHIPGISKVNAHDELTRIHKALCAIFEDRRVVDTPISMRCQVGDDSYSLDIEPVVAAIICGYPLTIIQGLVQLGAPVHISTLIWGLSMSGDVHTIQYLLAQIVPHDIKHKEQNLQAVAGQVSSTSSFVYTLYHHNRRLTPTDIRGVATSLLTSGASATRALLCILPERACGDFALLQSLLVSCTTPHALRQQLKQHSPALLRYLVRCAKGGSREQRHEEEGNPVVLLILYNKRLSPRDKAKLIGVWWKQAGIDEAVLRKLLQRHISCFSEEHQLDVAQVFGHSD